MNNNPLFSVLIANYNNGKYLDEAVNSVLNQTYSYFEIIIVDDASTDSSKEVLKKYASNSAIKIYYNEENKGCGYTKRKCAELASGEIAGFLDPDDIIADNALSLMVQKHQGNPECSLVYSTLFLCDENLNIQKRSNYQIQVPSNSSFLQMPSGRVSQFATFKMNLYRKTEGINAKFKRAVDQDLYFKMEEVGNLLYVDEPLYYYRVNQGGISSFKNYNKAFAWALVARIDACNRRRIDIEDVLPNLLESGQSIRAFYENSSAYKIGNLLLAPIRFVKRILGFYKQTPDKF